MICANGQVDIRVGDCRDLLRAMPDQSVNCIVTSPPYFGLRSYDENAVRIDPNLPPEKREWLELELARRGVHASR